MSRPQVIVWASAHSPRLSYVLDWLLHERLGLDYRLTTDYAELSQSSLSLCYGWQEGTFSIEASPMLFEAGRMPDDPEYGNWNGLWAPFLKESRCQIPFDMLAGIFLLLSRAEEYRSYNPDRHKRYPATDSLLYRAGVLNRPVVDEWVEMLRMRLQEAWSIEIPVVPFSVTLSYDLDIPRKHQHKSLGRSLGAVLRDLVRGDFSELNRRLAVRNQKQPDPYNSFGWLSELHKKLDVRPFWFILAAQQASDFDRNASPEAPFMQSLIRELDSQAELGVHPSYYSDKHTERLIAEKAVLERIAGNEMFRSRQHFIRLFFPQTYHALIAAGIRVDYSMGYSTHLGFRAGTGHSFPWYDLTVEQTRALRLVPFAFMDTTARFDQSLSADEALKELLALAERLKKVNSPLTTIFHNFSLGGDKSWKGWKEMYEKFLEEMNKMGGFQGK